MAHCTSHSTPPKGQIYRPQSVKLSLLAQKGREKKKQGNERKEKKGRRGIRETHFELGPEARGPLPAVVLVRGAGVAAGVALRVQPERASLVFLGCDRREARWRRGRRHCNTRGQIVNFRRVRIMCISCMNFETSAGVGRFWVKALFFLRSWERRGEGALLATRYMLCMVGGFACCSLFLSRGYIGCVYG